MKPYTDKIDKIDASKALYSEIKGNEKPRKKAARRVSKKVIDASLDTYVEQKQCAYCVNFNGNVCSFSGKKFFECKPPERINYDRNQKFCPRTNKLENYSHQCDICGQKHH